MCVECTDGNSLKLISTSLLEQFICLQPVSLQCLQKLDRLDGLKLAVGWAYIVGRSDHFLSVVVSPQHQQTFRRRLHKF